MSVVATTLPEAMDRQSARWWMSWAVLLMALAALYVPTCIGLYQQFWGVDNNSQGPIVIALACWLLVHKGREALRDTSLVLCPAPRLGAPWVVVGLLAYMLGRSQSLVTLEVASTMPTLAGISIVLFGSAFTRRIWFAFVFLIFAIPLPGSFTDALTQPLKIGVSWASEHLLHGAGYPVARAGVVLQVGQFQLLVADACAGLHSLFALEALGLVYLNVVRYESVLRNLLLAVLIVPVSFTANTARVVTLALITYHLGDEAGQGFLHNFSGMVLFMSALMLIVAIDAGLRRLSRGLAPS
jgi:exosortase B